MNICFNLVQRYNMNAIRMLVQTIDNTVSAVSCPMDRNRLLGARAALLGRPALTSPFWTHRASALVQSSHFNEGHAFGQEMARNLAP